MYQLLQKAKSRRAIANITDLYEVSPLDKDFQESVLMQTDDGVM